MKYQDCAIAVQAAEIGSDRETAPLLADANINPSTGLASDYLNHFNEAIMLLEMVATCPDCLADFHRWQAMSYREHFLASKFKGRELAIAAYEASDPAARDRLDNLASTMTTVIETTRTTMTGGLSPHASGPLADRAAAWLKILVIRAGAVINGEIEAAQPGAPQAMVDQLMQRTA
ncbi:MAG TPA: hypothetical protein VFC54_10240 [Pseudolabrys sp.]|nr:hypothetical protein [Pseudolabrys sp.]